MIGNKYIDLRKGVVSGSIEQLFPEWQGTAERVAVFGPHDDDPLIGAGYALDAAAQNGAQLFAVLFCKGDCGYSIPEQKDTIIATRRQENACAMNSFGIPTKNILRLEYPDFSLLHHLGMESENGEDGIFCQLIRFIRTNKITRLLVPNGFYEHIDHTAVYLAGTYDVKQAGDAIMADYGATQTVKTYLQYSVWADFSPLDMFLNEQRKEALRANRAILCDASIEKKVFSALQCYTSQQKIIENLMQARHARDTGAGYIELYIDFDPRPKLCYDPYIQCVNQLMQKQTAKAED